MTKMTNKKDTYQYIYNFNTLMNHSNNELHF